MEDKAFEFLSMKKSSYLTTLPWLPGFVTFLMVSALLLIPSVQNGVSMYEVRTC